MTTNPNPNDFLAPCEVIDFHAAAIAELAKTLRSDNAVETARRCFEFVRDEVKHSSDHQLNPVTCSASEVLKHGTGYCDAKSHLLCALLRANGIPAGLCYQRLSIDGAGAPFCLHGLNAVYLEDHLWYRVDPRGNREGIDAQFDPPNETLAFSTALEGEFDLPQIYVQPLSEVVAALHTHTDWKRLYENLPDVSIP